MTIDPSKNVTDPSQGDQTSNPPANVATSASQGDQGNPSVEELQRKLAELERDNRKYRQERKQQEEAAALVTKQQLEEQGKYKELAEQHAARVQQLEPIQGRYVALSSVIAEQIATQTKDWPKEVKDLLPGDDEPVEKRLEHVQRLQALVNKMSDQQQALKPGNGPGPKASLPTPDQMKQDKMREVRAGGPYGRF